MLISLIILIANEKTLHQYVACAVTFKNIDLSIRVALL